MVLDSIDNIETTAASTSLDNTPVLKNKCLMEIEQCKTQIEELNDKIRLYNRSKMEYCKTEFLQQQSSLQEKHENTKAELEKQIYELEKQNQKLNNKQLSFYILTVIDFILFFYILYKNKGFIFRMNFRTN